MLVLERDEVLVEKAAGWLRHWDSRGCGCLTLDGQAADGELVEHVQLVVDIVGARGSRARLVLGSGSGVLRVNLLVLRFLAFDGQATDRELVEHVQLVVDTVKARGSRARLVLGSRSGVLRINVLLLRFLALHGKIVEERGPLLVDGVKTSRGRFRGYGSGCLESSIANLLLCVCRRGCRVHLVLHLVMKMGLGFCLSSGLLVEVIKLTLELQAICFDVMAICSSRQVRSRNAGGILRVGAFSRSLILWGPSVHVLIHQLLEVDDLGRLAVGITGGLVLGGPGRLAGCSLGSLGLLDNIGFA